MKHAGRLLDAEQRRGARRRAEPEGADGEPDGGDGEADEDDEADRVGDDPPQAEPGDDGEQAGEDENRRDDRPYRFPQEDEPGAPDRALDAAPGFCLDAGGNALHATLLGLGHPPTAFRRSCPPPEL